MGVNKQGLARLLKSSGVEYVSDGASSRFWVGDIPDINKKKKKKKTRYPAVVVLSSY